MNAYTVVQQNLFDIEASEAENKGHKKPNKNDTRDFILDIVDVFNGAILTHNTSWADVMPQRMLDVVTLARLKALMQGQRTATYVDCALYLFTRTLESPMPSEWADIYNHVCCTVTQEWFKEDHWEAVGAPRELSEWLQQKLDGLLRHIYEKRRTILRKKLSETEKASASARKSKSDAFDQQSLF